VAYRNLTAVGETGLHPGGGLPFDHRDLVPGLCQIPGAGHADDSGTKNENFHIRFAMLTNTSPQIQYLHRKDAKNAKEKRKRAKILGGENTLWSDRVFRIRMP
jgi:hypothetical protein